MYCEVELLARVLRKLASGLLANDGLILFHESLQGLKVEGAFILDARGMDRRFKLVCEEFRLDAQHGAAKHGNQPAIRIPRKAGISRDGYQAFYRSVI